MLYNAWLLRSIERIKDFTKKINIDDKKFEAIFQLASNNFKIHKELLDLSQIYKNEKLLALIFLAGDFKEFHKISNESKLIKKLQETLQKELMYETGFYNTWIFKEKTIVADFILSENKIAFDLEVDEKKKSLKIWMFSRNKPDFFKNISSPSLKIERNKILIFDEALENQKKAVKVIKNYLNEVRNGWVG